MDYHIPLDVIPVRWRDQLEQLRYLVAKVTHVHGATHSELLQVVAVCKELLGGGVDDRLGQGVLGARLRTLTNNFTPWPGACASVERLFKGLAAVCAELPNNEPADAT